MFHNPELMLLRIPAILLALTIHEFAHGYVAYLQGDRTAYNAGRVSLNPFVHLDFFGTAMLLFGPFGWAKPVPVDHRFFQNPRKASLYVSAAGPLSNVVLALICGYTLRILGNIAPSLVMNTAFSKFLILSIRINAGISFFNLLPVPPLDGSKVLLSLLPDNMISGYVHISKYLPPVLLVLIIAEWGLHIPIFSRLIYPIFEPYYYLITSLISFGA